MENKLTQWPDDPPTTTRHIRLLAEAAAEFFDVPIEGLKSAKRTNELVWPRSICIWAARQAGYSYPVLGKWWNRQHSTTHHAVQLVDELRKKPGYETQLRQFMLFFKNYTRNVEKK